MKRVSEQLLERPLLASGRENSTASSIKSILFQVHEDPGLDARLQSALALARAASAHVVLFQAIPFEAYTVRDAFASYIRPEIVTELEEHSASVRATLEAVLKGSGISWNLEATGKPLVPELLKRAAFSDLVVIGREPEDPGFGRSATSLLGEILCHSRVPICIPGAQILDPSGTLVIAWNGSVEAANAVRQAIGLIALASDVRVVRVDEGKAGPISDELLFAYLSSHGVPASLEIRSGGSRPSEVLVDHAAAIGASAIVMGAYGHSRAGEFVFGGMTRDLLLKCPISLIVIH